MDATAPAVDILPPTDVPALQAMVRELLTKNQQIEAWVAELTAKLDATPKHRFGPRSERRNRKDHFVMPITCGLRVRSSI